MFFSGILMSSFCHGKWGLKSDTHDGLHLGHRPSLFLLMRLPVPSMLLEIEEAHRKYLFKDFNGGTNNNVLYLNYSPSTGFFPYINKQSFETFGNTGSNLQSRQYQLCLKCKLICCLFSDFFHSHYSKAQLSKVIPSEYIAIWYF